AYRVERDRDRDGPAGPGSGRDRPLLSAAGAVGGRRHGLCDHHQAADHHRDPPGRLVPLSVFCPPGPATWSLSAAVPPPGWRVVARAPAATRMLGARRRVPSRRESTWFMTMAAEAVSPAGSRRPAFVARSQRLDQLAEARR